MYVYQLSIENATGYDDYVSALFDPITTSVLDVELQAVSSTTYTVTLGISTSDNGDVPVGSTYEFTNITDGEPGTVVLSGTVSDDQASPWSVPITDVEAGTYMLTITGADGYLDLTQTGIVDAEFTTFGVELQVIPPTTYTVILSVATSDDGNIPAGTSYTFTDSNDTMVLSDTLAADQTSPWAPQITDVPAGDYTLAVTGAAGYEDLLQSATVDAEHTNFSVTLQASYATSFAITTSDNGDIPVGTAIEVFNIMDGEPGAQMASIELTDPEVSPFSGLLGFLTPGTYRMDVFAPGYQTFSQIYTISENQTSFDVFLQAIPSEKGTIELTVRTADNGDIPAGTIITVGAISYTMSDLLGMVPVSAADVASGTVIETSEIPAGTQALTVTQAAPYADFSGSIDVVAGDTIAPTITLQLAQEPTATIAPTETAESTATAAPTETAGLAQVSPKPTKTAAKFSAVTGLPNTGQGQSDNSPLGAILLLGSVLLVFAVGTLALRSRNQTR